MALSPETADALKQAIEAIVQECGDDPQYHDLTAALTAAEQAIPHGEGHAPAHGADHAAAGEDPNTMSGDDAFAAAEAKHKAARKKPAGGHDNPFADKANA